MILRLISFLCALLIAFPAMAGDAARCEREVSHPTPIAERLDSSLLFAVSDDCSRPTSYLFGTIHMDDPEIIAASDGAFGRLKAARVALFELEMSEKSQRSLIATMIMPPSEPRNLSDIIGDRQFSRLLAETERNRSGFPRALLERHRPWAASIVAQYPTPSNDGVSLDDRLQQLARVKKIPVTGLETPDEQLRVFTSLSEGKQIAMLHDTLQHMAHIRSMNDRLEALYRAGNLAGIETLGKEAFQEISDAGLRRHLQEGLIDRRNRTMTLAMQPYLKRGGSFVAIGALHLPGKNGILQRLEAAGFTIWPDD